LPVTTPLDSSPALYYKRSIPCVYLAPLRRYFASNIGRTDVDTERKTEEGKEEEGRKGKGKEKWKGKRREKRKEKKDRSPDSTKNRHHMGPSWASVGI